MRSGYLARCLVCGREYGDPLRFKCDCGSPLELSVDLGEFDRSRIRDIPSMWRYIDAFPYIKGEELITLGEGWTPLIELDDNLYAKMDFMNPTGSFKDRGASAIMSTLIGHLKGIGSHSFISEDSSGNAGASIAAYAARAGIRARIYVPATASGRKIDQIKAYGAELVKLTLPLLKRGILASRVFIGLVFIALLGSHLIPSHLRSRGCATTPMGIPPLRRVPIFKTPTASLWASKPQ